MRSRRLILVQSKQWGIGNAGTATQTAGTREISSLLSTLDPSDYGNRGADNCGASIPIYARRRFRFVGLRSGSRSCLETMTYLTDIDRRVPNPQKVHTPAKKHPWQISIRLAVTKASGDL